MTTKKKYETIQHNQAKIVNFREFFLKGGWLGINKQNQYKGVKN